MVISKEKEGSDDGASDAVDYEIEVKEKKIGVKKINLAEAKKEISKLEKLMTAAEETIVKETKLITTAKDVKPDLPVEKAVTEKPNTKLKEPIAGEPLPGEKKDQDDNTQIKEEKEELKSDEA